VSGLRDLEQHAANSCEFKRIMQPQGNAAFHRDHRIFSAGLLQQMCSGWKAKI